MEKITQADREDAAAKIKGSDAKAVAIRTRIVAGEVDDHPGVQGAAFYRTARATESVS